MMTLYHVFLASLVFVIGGTQGYVRMCYYTNWAQYRGFKPDKIDPFVCTHIVYAFAKLSGNQILDIEWNEKTIQSGVVGWKNTNPNLKVLLAIGGWNADNTQYVNLVANETAMLTFADNAVTYLRGRGFDGLDLDWEYPANLDRRGTAADRVRFTRWLQILQNKFINEAAATNRPRLLLTAAVAAPMPRAADYYEIGKIGTYLDYANLMTYDFHGSWDGPTLGVQHHSPLYPEGNSSVQGWIAAGFPANKIAMGMGAYGRSYTLNAKPAGTGIGAKPSGYAILNYYAICDKLNNGYQLIPLTEKVGVAALGQKWGQWEWIGFDNANTFTVKAQYIKANGLAGSMVWALDQDDHNNTCGGGNYPLLTALQQQLPAGTVNRKNNVGKPPGNVARKNAGNLLGNIAGTIAGNIVAGNLVGNRVGKVGRNTAGNLVGNKIGGVIAGNPNNAGNMNNNNNNAAGNMNNNNGAGNMNNNNGAGNMNNNGGIINNNNAAGTVNNNNNNGGNMNNNNNNGAGNMNNNNGAGNMNNNNGAGNMNNNNNNGAGNMNNNNGGVNNGGGNVAGNNGGGNVAGNKKRRNNGGGGNNEGENNVGGDDGNGKNGGDPED